MFETSEDISTYTNGRTSERPPIYKRATSSNNVANKTKDQQTNKDVNEELIPNYSFETTEELYYNRSSASRLASTGDRESTFNTNFLEADLNNVTTNGIISSLMSDNSGRNPFDIDNFSSYSSRLLSAGSDIVETSLDHATLSMQQLYVDDKSSDSASSQLASVNSAFSLSESLSKSSSQVNMGSTSASTTVPAAAQVNNVTASTPIIVPSPAVVTGLPTIPDFRPSNVVNSAPSNINPLVYQPHYQYIPVDPLSSGMNSYYSQPMYVDQLGQPIYYRVGAQEVVYTSPDGNTMAAGVDPNVQYVQIPVNNYWPNPQDPNVQMMQGVNGQLYAHPGIPTYQTIDANGMVRRVLYNPALGYSSNGMMNMNPGKMIPAMYMQGHPQIMENHDVNYPNGVQRDEYYNRNDDHDISRNRNGRVDRNNNNNRIDKSTRKNISTPNLNNNSASTNTPSRDSLVEEFRNTYGKGRQWSLRDLTGHVVAFCQDQHGSRFIQQRLEVCSDNEKQVVFDEVIPTANLLMTDVFGNYVLQKLFEFGACEQCDMLSSLLVGQCVELSMQMYGCRVVQKALEYVSISRLVVLVSEFEDPDVLLNCVHDANGNHVIQKCIEVISKAARDSTDKEMKQYLNNKILLIINTFRNKVKELSSHPYGCRVIQRILEHCNNSQKSIVLEELRQCCTELVQDCYGNYVIQFVMQHGWDDDRAILIKEVHANLLDFSQHKFASNVVEKCLQYAVKRDRDEMIWKIINATFDPKSPIDGKGNSALETMVRDPYANYVVQKVIDVSDEKQRGAILRYVKDNIQQLRRYTYGKHIIMRLEKITNEKF